MEPVIKQRIYLWGRKPEIYVALPPVLSPAGAYAPGAIMRAMENPTKSELVVAVYRYGGEVEDVKDYHYYEFVGVKVT